MNKSDNLNQLSKALLMLQSELQPAPKDMTSDMYGKKGGRPYRYASLQSIIETARPLLLKNRLLISHQVEANELVCMLRHIDGEFITSRYPLIYNLGDIRSFSSAVTYGMKDTYRTMLGMICDDDTDGETIE